MVTATEFIYNSILFAVCFFEKFIRRSNSFNKHRSIQGVINFDEFERKLSKRYRGLRYHTWKSNTQFFIEKNL